MRAVLALALLLLAAPAAAAAPVEIRGADPETYTLDMDYSPSGDGVLSGSERIDFVNRGPLPVDRVWLRLWANGPDRCSPRRIRVRIEAPAAAGAESVRCTALEVRLGAPVAPGEQGSVALTFRVGVRPDSDRFGRAGPTALLGNVIPVLAVEDGGGLHLEPYSELGESFYSLSARWDAVLRAPSRMRAATTGAVASETVAGGVRTVTAASGQARDFGLVIGPLRVLEAREGGVNVRVFAAWDVRRAEQGLRSARRALRLLSRRLGPYDSTELDVVMMRRVFEAGGAGMEYPELIMTLPAPEVITHEVAHQWWYGLVGNNQRLEPWLDESFASYEHERLHPRTSLCSPRRPYQQVSPWRRHIPLDTGMDVFDRASPFALSEVVYLAGACALRRLERDLGETRMTAVLRLLQTRFRHGVMTKTDVLDAVTEIAPDFALGRWMRLAHLRR